LQALAESLPAGIRSGDIGLERGHALVIGLVIALGLIVTVMLSGLGRPSVTPVAEPASTVLTPGTPVPVSAVADERATPEARPGTVIVHVAGKVGTPGIVELPAGSRVVDAVDAAGGADDGVDLSSLNLARVLVDGEQVAVGIDTLPVAPVGATGETASPIVNLNTATSADLETLPGIGPTLAANIIAWREENGRFTMVEELQEVSGIGPKKFEALADQVTV
jgi:competence protein ComEA